MAGFDREALAERAAAGDGPADSRSFLARLRDQLPTR